MPNELEDFRHFTEIKKVCIFKPAKEQLGSISPNFVLQPKRYRRTAFGEKNQFYQQLCNIETLHLSFYVYFMSRQFSFKQTL